MLNQSIFGWNSRARYILIRASDWLAIIVLYGITLVYLCISEMCRSKTKHLREMCRSKTKHLRGKYYLVYLCQFEVTATHLLH